MITRNIIFFCIVGFLVNKSDSFSQSTTDIAQATEFSIPSSGAFNLMGVNPAAVSRPGFTKDFTLDNFVKDGKMLDNIAMEAQPFWILFFKNKNINDYRNMASIVRALSNINVSLGTTKQQDIRKLAWSGKITLRNDPMMDADYIKSIDKTTIDEGFNEKKTEMAIAIRRLKKQIETENDETEKAKLQKDLEAKQGELTTFHLKIEENVSKKMKFLAAKYIEDHWTDPVVDIGAGEIYNYTSPSLDSIDFSTNGFGIWVNPAWGFKASKSGMHKIQLAGLLKWIRIGSKDDLYAGMNIRYGTSKVNAFLELVYENNSNNVSNTFGYGLSYKIDNKKVIEAGLKQVLDKNMKLKNFYPVVSFNWALAKDILK